MNQTANDQHTVTVDNTAPTVSITNPANGSTVSGTVSITADASDDNGISKVIFYIDGVSKSTDTSSPYSYSWNTTAESDGSHTINVIAYDTVNQTANDQHTVTVDNIDETPTVSITNPANGSTVSGTVNVTADAGDDNGISKVIFYIDEVSKSTVTSSPYSYSWDTTAESNSSHAVKVIAYDNIGQTATDQHTVTVNNPHELPDTGQTTGYTATAGEDNDYNPSATQMSYTDNGDGTITDNRTGLMWLKDASNYNSGGAQTWKTALSGCEGFSYAGYSDWRLPNRRELFSIVKFEGVAAPFINTTYFLNTVSGAYWTSTTYVPGGTDAMAVCFNNGSVIGYSKTGDRYVRPVRGGP